MHLCIFKEVALYYIFSTTIYYVYIYQSIIIQKYFMDILFYGIHGFYGNVKLVLHTVTHLKQLLQHSCGFGQGAKAKLWR